MLDHKLVVSNRRISCENPTILANGVNSDSISLEFDEEWNDFNVAIILGKPGHAVSARYEGKPLSIPPQFLSKTGYIPVSIVGQNETQRITTYACPTLLYVVRSGVVNTGGGE